MCGSSRQAVAGEGLLKLSVWEKWHCLLSSFQLWAVLLSLEIRDHRTVDSTDMRLFNIIVSKKKKKVTRFLPWNNSQIMWNEGKWLPGSYSLIYRSSLGDRQQLWPFVMIPMVITKSYFWICSHRNKDRCISVYCMFFMRNVSPSPLTVFSHLMTR